MENQLIPVDSLFVTAFTNQRLGQTCRFTIGHHPAHNLATENVENHVQVEVGPLPRPLELCTIPTPHLIRTRGQQLRSGIGRMTALVPPFANLFIRIQDSIHRARRTQIALFVQ